MEGMQAYGAGKAGGAFDPVTFIQQPQTIIRIVSWVSERQTGNLYKQTGARTDTSGGKLRNIHVNLPKITFFQFVYIGPEDLFCQHQPRKHDTVTKLVVNNRMTNI